MNLTNNSQELYKNAEASTICYQLISLGKQRFGGRNLGKRLSGRRGAFRLDWRGVEKNEK